MSSEPNDEYLKRVKDEIRAEAQALADRSLLPCPGPSTTCRAGAAEGIDRERLDYTLGELSDLQYRAFVDHAFRAILKRTPERREVDTLLLLLSKGSPKAELLGNLRWSPEGRSIGVHVRGLLSRYILAKGARIPVLGFLIEWGTALVSLTLLLRHQRAADASTAAGFFAMGETQRLQAERLGAVDASVADVQRDLARRSDELAARTAELAANTTERAAVQERHIAQLETEIVELRHHVLSMNHWVVSLQNAVAGIEDVAMIERAQADALLAAVASSADETAARSARHAEWVARLGTALGEGAALLDLGSGDGAWLAALAPHRIDASGIEANALLVAQARKRGLHVEVGDSFTALTRCADAGLDAVSLGVGLLADDATLTRRVLDEIMRGLKPGGHLLLRIENDPHLLARSISNDPAGVDAPHWAAILTAAGFVAVSVMAASSAAVVFARRPPA